MNPRPTVNDYLQLPQGETVVNIQPYQMEHKKPALWQFWKKEKVKYMFAVLTNNGRFYIVDPDNLTLEEKPNQY